MSDTSASRQTPEADVTAEPVAWHCLTPTDTAARLGVDTEQGLSPAEAEARLERYGPNQLAEKPPTPPWAIFFEQFKSLLILLLLGASVLAALIGHVRDAVVILVVTLINSVLGFYQEYRAERSVAALKRMLVLRPRVRRGGELVAVDADVVVPGDVMLLETGDRVAADGRLLEAHSLEIDESSLTGESHPVAKVLDAADDPELPLADRTSMVYMNSVVTRGRGWLLVTATGQHTEIGRLATALSAEDEGPTPLQIQLDHLGKRLSAVAGVLVGVIFLLGVLKGTSLANMIIQAIALAVAAIPEGLPAVVTVTLALGMRRMVRARAIVKRLVAVETLGSTSVICSDKTGTLTLNQMTAQAGCFRGRRFRVSGEGYEPNGEISLEEPGADEAGEADTEPEWAPLLRSIALCNDSQIDAGRLVGDPTEGALLTLAHKGSLRREDEEARTPRIAEIPFDSATQYMATFHEGDDGAAALHLKGAPEVVLARCDTWLGPQGEQPLDDAARERLAEENGHLARQGYRVLAVATAQVERGAVAPQADLDALARGLTFLGLVGLIDPPRPEARDAIALCRHAGIQVKMITGDQRDTAAAVARALGLRRRIITGPEMDRLDEAELAERIGRIDVFARVTPEHKMKIVRSLKAQRHVVAMTGDGVNDAPALKIADIGVAMGVTGTEVAKEAASMVLTDDNFATIVRAVREGRGIYDNIVKFVRFQLSTNLGAIFTVLTALLLELPEPFNPIQILWINIIMDGPPAMSLGVDPVARDVMSRPPRAPGERILGLGRLSRLVLFGAIMTVGTLGVLMWGLEQRPGEAAWAATLAFTTFVVYQLFNAFNARSEKLSAFTGQFFTNRVLWLSILGAAGLQALALHWGPLSTVFHTAELSWSDWAVAVGVASSILIIEEFRKLFTGALAALTSAGEEEPAAAGSEPATPQVGTDAD